MDFNFKNIFKTPTTRKERVEYLIQRLGWLTYAGIVASFSHAFMIVTLFSSSGYGTMIIVALFVLAMDFGIAIFTDYLIHQKAEASLVPWYQYLAFGFTIVLSFVLNAIYFSIHAPIALITETVGNPMLGSAIGFLSAFMLAALIPVFIAVAPTMKATLEIDLATGINTANVKETKDELLKKLSSNPKFTQEDIYQIVGGSRNEVCKRIRELRNGT